MDEVNAIVAFLNTLTDERYTGFDPATVVCYINMVRE